MEVIEAQLPQSQLDQTSESVTEVNKLIKIRIMQCKETQHKKTSQKNKKNKKTHAICLVILIKWQRSDITTRILKIHDLQSIAVLYQSP
jgi:hypothetical protein